MRELIRQFPELGDFFSEIETRLLALENSLPFNVSPTGERASISKPETWTPKMWDRFQQLEGRVIHVENESMEQRAKKTDAI